MTYPVDLVGEVRDYPGIQKEGRKTKSTSGFMRFIGQKNRKEGRMKMLEKIYSFFGLQSKAVRRRQLVCRLWYVHDMDLAEAFGSKFLDDLMTSSGQEETSSADRNRFRPTDKTHSEIRL